MKTTKNYIDRNCPKLLDDEMKDVVERAAQKVNDLKGS
jgi:hypothetical protein